MLTIRCAFRGHAGITSDYFIAGNGVEQGGCLVLYYSVFILTIY
jgi:hypothetical protein